MNPTSCTLSKDVERVALLIAYIPCSPQSCQDYCAAFTISARAEAHRAEFRSANTQSCPARALETSTRVFWIRQSTPASNLLGKLHNQEYGAYNYMDSPRRECAFNQARVKSV